ncbi:MAG: DNA translocase FtsK, partial [Clostridia bacterium]|nr:DNA translocase FtsK [Clostridia bacterium]
TNEDGSITQQENPEDADPVFTPPTEAQLEDTPERSTKMAMEAGVPLDRAVVAGRRMLAEDGPLSPEEEIMAELEESSVVPPRMMEYYMPTLDLLDPPEPRNRTREEIRAELEEKANRLLDTLRSFKVEAWITNITQGPSVTRFELQPGVGVKVSKITSLTDDIALSLAAPGVRIEAPIPGKSAIGIEIPNKEASPVPIREVLESDKFQNFQSKTAFALGKDIGGSCVVADIAKFPHVLIAGQTGSGKSVCINSLILSILFKAKPDEVKLIMVDPKMVELGIYNGIPHLLIPVVTDPKHAAGALNWAVVEMQNRYQLLKDNNVRNLKGYNALMEERGEPDSKLPEIVIIIDEFADLMIAAKNEVEDAINRLAALARAAGMYLVIATQRPTVNVITGVIKANIPSRIAFNVTSQVDSRTIIDMTGAEKLLGRGDMLYNPSGSVKPQRIQGNFVSDAEIERVIEFIKGQYEAEYDEAVLENIQREQERITASLEGGSHHEEEDGSTRSGGEARDELFFQAVEMVLENGQASVAMFQRRFKIGYQRAARLIDQMEERRIIGPYEGTKPRQVLISRQEFNEMRMNQEE